MTKYLAAYGFTAAIFLLIDFIWLAFVARGFYMEQIGFLMRERPDFVAAGIFYLAFAAGVVYFAVNPALAADSAMTALINGAILGFLAYATYDVTNYSTLRDWPVLVSVVDVIWGTALTAVSAWGGFLATRAVFGS